MAIIIGIKGPSQSGKTTLANVIQVVFQQRYSHYARIFRTSFSDYVRDEIVEWVTLPTPMPAAAPSRVRSIWHAYRDRFGSCPDLLLTHLEKRPADADSRFIQQWWGQDYRRSQDPLYWVKAYTLDHLEDMIEPSPTILLLNDSVRQPNEGALIHALGGIVIDCEELEAPTGDEATARSHSVEQIASSWKGDVVVNMKRDYFDKDQNERYDFILSLIARATPSA